MSITMLASLAYMWIAKTPDAPFGTRAVRWLLVGRGLSGFFGGERAAPGPRTAC